jgi:hypothetical protein
MLHATHKFACIYLPNTNPHQKQKKAFHELKATKKKKKKEKRKKKKEIERQNPTRLSRYTKKSTTLLCSYATTAAYPPFPYVSHQ